MKGELRNIKRELEELKRKMRIKELKWEKGREDDPKDGKMEEEIKAKEERGKRKKVRGMGRGENIREQFREIGVRNKEKSSRKE